MTHSTHATADRPAHSSVLPFVLATLTVLFWSGNLTMGRGVNDQIAPFALAFWRWLIAFAVLLPLGIPRVRRDWPLIRAHWPAVLLLGMLGVPFFNTMTYFAFHTTTAINVSVINVSMPLVIVLISWAVFGDKLTMRQGIGVAVSLLGVLWLAVQGTPERLLALEFVPGDLWMVGAVIIYASYTAFLRLRPAGLSPIAFLQCITAIGVVPLLIGYLIERTYVGDFTLTWELAGVIAYMGGVASVLAYAFWNAANAAIGANRAGIFMNLLPVFTTALAVAFLDEPLETYQIVGMVVVLAGVALVTRKRRARA